MIQLRLLYPAKLSVKCEHRKIVLWHTKPQNITVHASFLRKQLEKMIHQNFGGKSRKRKTWNPRNWGCHPRESHRESPWWRRVTSQVTAESQAQGVSSLDRSCSEAFWWAMTKKRVLRYLDTVRNLLNWERVWAAAIFLTRKQPEGGNKAQWLQPGPNSDFPCQDKKAWLLPLPSSTSIHISMHILEGKNI